jgi:hypothetical protein
MRILISSILAFAVGCTSINTPPAQPVHRTVTLFSNSEIAVPVAGITRVPQSVGLEWDAPADAGPDEIASYNLYVANDPAIWDGSIIPLGNVTNYTVTGLVGGAQYYFAVTDVDTNGSESDFSDILGTTTHLVLDLSFAFEQPVANVTLQASPDLIHWGDLGMIPTNGTWRVFPDPSIPALFYRGMGATTQ